MSTTTTSDLKFSLLENGLDFIQSALLYLRGAPDKHALKYGVLHLSAGVELVLKERLRQEHWSLVFEKTDQANVKSYETGDFNSVIYDTCIKRLAGVCNVILSDKARQTLQNLRSKRNRFEHFGIVDSTAAIKASAADALSTLVDFINEQFTPKALSEHSATLDDIRSTLKEFDTFVLERWKSIKGAVQQAAGSKVSCPRCNQPALVLSGSAECLFCGYTASPEEAAEDYITEVLGYSQYEVVKDGGDWPLMVCPECGSHTLVDRGGEEDGTEGQYVCFECGEAWDRCDLEACYRCGEHLVIHSPFCDNCSDFIASQ